MKRRPQTVPAAPTPGPWEIDGERLVYRHWQYAGWPHFGQITVACLDGTWPVGQERQANLRLITVAVNACFSIAPATPASAALALPGLVHAVEDCLAYRDDPNMPVRELQARLRNALNAVREGSP